MLSKRLNCGNAYVWKRMNDPILYVHGVAWWFAPFSYPFFWSLMLFSHSIRERYKRMASIFEANNSKKMETKHWTRKKKACEWDVCVCVCVRAEEKKSQKNLHAAIIAIASQKCFYVLMLSVDSFHFLFRLVGTVAVAIQKLVTKMWQKCAMGMWVYAVYLLGGFWLNWFELKPSEPVPLRCNQKNK